MDKKEFEQNIPLLALFAASILGLYIRLNPVLQADFPLNDGAFFVAMTEELLEANFRLPVFSNYNFLQIPNAYPPLGFYLAALLVRITKLNVVTLFRFLPAILSWLTIPAFFLAAGKLLKSSLAISLSVIIFALLPRSWLWLIMGGGLTRSLGLLFSILTIYFAYQLFTQQKKFLPTILCFALTALSHPEAIVFAVLNLGLLFLLFNRSKTGLLHLIRVGFGALVISSPWWITVMLRHGAEPFLAASNTSGLSLSVLNHIIRFDLSGEPGPALFASLAMIGLFFGVAKKDYFLPLSALLSILMIPSSGPNYLSVPLAMLAALALSEVILPGISQIRDKLFSTEADSPHKLPTESKILLVYLLINLLFSASVAATELESPLQSVSPEEREAMQWISEKIPEDSKFLVISGAHWWDDQTCEWFPYLTQRQTLNTIQGSEWLPEDHFNRILTWRTVSLQALDESTGYLNEMRTGFEIPFSHIYLVKRTDSTPLANTRAFELELRQDPDYKLIYDGPAGMVFERLP